MSTARRSAPALVGGVQRGGDPPGAVGLVGVRVDLGDQPDEGDPPAGRGVAGAANHS